MREGIDKSFDAVIFIGYHAKAGTPNAILEHTMSSRNITDVSINGISLPEAGINALIAGYYDVPVVFLSGELAVCHQIKELLYTSLRFFDGVLGRCCRPPVDQSDEQSSHTYSHCKDNDINQCSRERDGHIGVDTQVSHD